MADAQRPATGGEQDGRAPEVHVHVTEWMVTALPVDHPAAHQWAVWVQAWPREPGRYIVSNGRGAPGMNMCLNSDGEWDENRTRFDQVTTLALALTAAPKVRWNDLTAADILRRDAERKAATTSEVTS